MVSTPKRRWTPGRLASGELTAAACPPHNSGIVAEASAAVKQEVDGIAPSKKQRGPGRKKKRRQAHGSAWHWRQTDRWYYTLPGTKKRVPLFDDDGQPIRGLNNKKAAQLAFARLQLAGTWQPTSEHPVAGGEWLVAKVCSEYLQFCERGAASGSGSKGHHENASWILNDLCKYCGALPVAELKKGHIKTWIESHPTWTSPATHRSAIAVVLAAFNQAQVNYDVPNPLKGLKKPQARPRLSSFSKEDEEALYQEADKLFGDFLLAAMHTGLRPFCELAHLTADDVEETPRGLMWRVYSSKTKKTRKIPVRAEVAALTRELMATAPKGSRTPLFRNSKGTIWTKVAGVARFIALRKRLGWDKDPLRKKYSSYTCRHTFAHRMLSGYWNGGVGCSIETLAELIGDTPKVAFDHYGKEWGQHYQDPLWAAIGMAAHGPGSHQGNGARKKRPQRKK